ncbi:MAG: low affinity iron permease family protein [Gemmatimonadota bacterium]
MPRSSSWFTHFSRGASRVSGRPATFLVASGLILLWAVTGPIFHYSDTWQLVINTSTTVITFLMVFVIQSTQNRDSEAMHVKLDELIKSLDVANNCMLDLEELEEEELDQIREEFQQLAAKARKAVRAESSTGDAK